jgi:hypothetical protein
MTLKEDIELVFEEIYNLGINRGKVNIKSELERQYLEGVKIERFNKSFLKLRKKIDKLELIKVADKSLGYNGLGTKMTPKEIDKMFSAIVTYLEGGKE